jgi:hypothetical protein
MGALGVPIVDGRGHVERAKRRTCSCWIKEGSIARVKINVVASTSCR